MLEFINFFTDVLSKYVSLLFSLELTDGVSVGSFMIGCAVFSIILGYLLGRFLLSPSDAESHGAVSRAFYKQGKELDKEGD